MKVVAAVDWGGAVGLIVLFAVFAWLLIAGGTDAETRPGSEAGGDSGADDAADPADPNAPDADGFTPADKYGYGYDYSWGDPFGDKDL